MVMATKKLFWRHMYNVADEPKSYEKNFMPSKTIPDQTMSLKILLERFTRGLPLPSASGYGEAQYYGEDEDYMINPSTLDLAEREEILRNNKNRIHDLNNLNKAEQEAIQRAIADAKQKAEEAIQKTKVDTVGTTT
ncbi:hypothetical protein [Blackfly microvirus SF02]|uniref:Uncharacterized protein n=1 Tax=Blackfly microvirus SF02 TaxID=2576452 RepID=A0A4P8PLW9_9VIRU|nr:hypothetical protein [Blackfly microvirus SF02]